MLTKITKHAEMVGFCQLFGFKTESIYFKETKGFFVFPLLLLCLITAVIAILCWRTDRNEIQICRVDLEHKRDQESEETLQKVK